MNLKQSVSWKFSLPVGIALYFVSRSGILGVIGDILGLLAIILVVLGIIDVIKAIFTKK